MKKLKPGIFYSGARGLIVYRRGSYDHFVNHEERIENEVRMKPQY